ncbi:MAG: chorismate--pyruvate lyase [Clostridia bacterium]|nr:chorismate--pyruvate lyase [Clostridia bacterium]
MGPYDYIVTRIDGDYAHLRRVDIESEEDLLVARALLPFETDEGTKLHYECGIYMIES